MRAAELMDGCGEKPTAGPSTAPSTALRARPSASAHRDDKRGMGIYRPEGRCFHGDACGRRGRPCHTILLHSDAEEVKPTHFFVFGLHYIRSVAARRKKGRPARGCVVRSFEYKFEVDLRDAGAELGDPEMELNRLGADGWELVSAVPVPMRKTEDVSVQYIFKREKSKMELGRSSYAYGA